MTKVVCAVVLVVVTAHLNKVKPFSTLWSCWTHPSLRSHFRVKLKGIVHLQLTIDFHSMEKNNKYRDQQLKVNCPFKYVPYLNFIT